MELTGEVCPNDVNYGKMALQIQLTHQNQVIRRIRGELHDNGGEFWYDHHGLRGCLGYVGIQDKIFVVID